METKRYENIFWMCLKDLCPKNCCSRLFGNGSAFTLCGLVKRDRIPLLLEEKNKIIRRAGSMFVVRGFKDDIHYLKSNESEDCPFFIGGMCEIEDMKPSLCRAFPLVGLSSRVGAVFDYNFCPGFKSARELNRRMTRDEYTVMLESFLNLQQYWIERLKLEIRRC